MARLYEFGKFRLDAEAHVLFRDSRLVRLTPKAVETLLALLERHGQVLDKDDLIRRVWPDTFVEEINLTRNISVLRKMLGNELDGKDYIETIPKRGYRFVAEVRVPERVKPNLQIPASVGASVPSGFVALRSMALLTLGAIVVLSAGVYGALHYFRPRAGETPAEHVLAILPVQNLTGEPEREYVTDGLTQEMIAHLGSLGPRQLRVIAWTSSMAYKQSNKTVEQIGRELAADYILEAGLRGNGNRMRLTAQLIRVRNQGHVWAHEYEIAPGDVLEFQDEVAIAIARQIHLQLTAAAEEQLERSRHVVPESYDSYLKGRFFLGTRTREGLWKSVEQFQKAIDKDPASAQAYAGLADTYNMLMFYGYFRGTRGVLYAKAAAESAIERDESLAEAHAALAYTNFMWLWDWPGAENEFRRSIELNPSYVPAHHWYALYLAAAGRQNEAVQQITFAQMLDPLSPIVNTAIGYVSYFGRQFDAAIGASQAVLAKNPNFMVAHAVLGLGYEGKGEYEKAIAEFQKANELSGETKSVYLGWLGHAYAASGRKAQAEEVLSELDELAKQGFPRLSHKAFIYTALGQTELALQSLRGARDQDDGALVWLKVDPRYDPLRADSRFKELLALGNLASFQPSR